ncbi:MAG: hypothetical protein ACRES3_04920 [Steroidobacteraceae bacterium]
MSLSEDDHRLVEEMRARPLGPHSPNLQRLLNAWRSAPAEGKPVLIVRRPNREWILGELGPRGAPVRVFGDPVFTDLAAAEWYVFKLRWQRQRGTALE